MVAPKHVGHLSKYDPVHCIHEDRPLTSIRQGIPQSIQLSFDQEVTPRELRLTFQGGFVGKACRIEAAKNQDAKSRDWVEWTKVFPEDVNRQQIFELPTGSLQGPVQSLKLVFEESTDFFGRITVYDLQLLGHFSQ